MIIRQAHDRDADCIASIYNHYVRIGGATFDKDPWTIGQTRQLLNGSDSGLWVVACQNEDSLSSQLDGWASARPFSVRHGYRFSLESAVYVNDQSKRRGIGRQLMEALIETCQQQSIHYLMARIVAGNEGSIDFHRRLGYEVIGTQKEVGHMDDQWLDVVLLQKLL
ncbi:GNAT family N-acetyltransferase [Rubripirellula obstinata]|nr:GNAT family N-acetyltransferase [Rubripirellula obstinata]